ncbi:hypothetical protein J7I93_24835, partial [Bacillus sp. ISL-47]|uniref:hypothetical protein n=1 Tax=Bacillus sp. ISL-47 TaxID=2819130 RepID=UPI001BED0F22
PPPTRLFPDYLFVIAENQVEFPGMELIIMLFYLTYYWHWAIFVKIMATYQFAFERRISIFKAK